MLVTGIILIGIVYYFLGLTESAIAKSEGVSVASVSESIQRGLRNMETFLKNRL